MAKKRTKPKTAPARSAKPKAKAAKKRNKEKTVASGEWRSVSAARLKEMLKTDKWLAGIDLGMRRAAKAARKVARMHGTPVYFWKNGKVVAEEP